MLEKLQMIIGLTDQVTKPLRGIMKDVDGAMNTAKSGMQNMATGGAGLVATGFAIQSALMPAIEMDRKVGEVKSLGVTDEALKQLSKTALKFSAEYGKSATEFVDASYDIKSAMGNLNGVELAGITESSAILAAATKADTKTITDYMGTMYGIFETQAEKMGKADWAAQVAGMTAKSVEMFKTDGNKMAQAFSRLGSSATAFGVDMSEQMAVLGSLGASMGGGEAATKYTAFLTGATTAQKKLGLSFFDSSGKMLPMVEILDKIQGRIGHMKDDKQFQVLKNAFGSVEAVKLIQNLQSKTGSLTEQIDELGKIKGIDQAKTMASAMTDQWERLEASWFAVRAAAFGMILPSFNAIAGSIADGLTWLTAMTDQYPMLTQVISYAAIGVVSLSGVVAALSLAMGIGQMMSAGWAVTMGTLSGSLKLLGMATQLLTLKTWLLNAAFWANPITLIVGGIVAATAAIWVFRDYIGAFLSGFIDGFVKASGVAELFKPLIQVFQLIGSAISWAFNWVIQLLTPIDAVAESLAGFASAGEMVGMIIGTIFRGILMPIKLVMTAIEQFISLLNMIPGVDITLDSSVEKAVKIADETSAQSMSAVQQPPTESLFNYTSSATEPRLSQNMVKNMNTSQSKETNNIRQYGDVYVTTTEAFSFDMLEEDRILGSG
ncbi:phage tail tape measure protein [Vibrio fluvialis]|nr:phage tail tape measure protein [Vibrio fluvialis]